MSNSDYKRLEKIFSNLNEAIIVFYSDISELMPEFKEEILDGLRLTLDSANNIYKLAANKIFTNIHK